MAFGDEDRGAMVRGGIAEAVDMKRKRSVCQWEDSAGLVFKLTVYWTGGKQGWEMPPTSASCCRRCC